MKLATYTVEKPWGRRDIPAAFGDMRADGVPRQIGEIWYDAPEKLPLLVKWLFTSEKLSVQVHPNDDQAAARGLQSGKEECWYIVDAAPDAVLGMGMKERLSAADLRAAALSGEIEQLMDWRAVAAGDYFYIPAGTVHAIGAGITLIEIQQNADITYRLYDYQRLDNGKLRDLHLDDGVDVSLPAPYADPRHGHAAGNMQLANGPHFRLWHIDSADGLDMLPKDTALWITPIDGDIGTDSGTVGVGECAYIARREQIQHTQPAKILIAAI